MRQALRANPQKKPPTFTLQRQAPVKGWMSQESFAEAEDGSAVILTNFFPEANAVRARRGNTSFATGLDADVTSLLRYVSATASKLFAATSTKIYDITGGGAVGAAAVTGLANAYWQQTMFATAAGQFGVYVNGANGVRTFDGATWVDQTGAITGTGGAVNTFIAITTHKRRLWFCADQSMDLYYLPTDAINGAAVKFGVGSLFKRGGYVMGMGTYSIDVGDGPDDFFVVVSSEGEFAVYQGTDPSTANTWALIGVFPMGKPIGRRSLFQAGGDLLVINEDGILAVSKLLHIDRAVASKQALTARIRQAYVDAVKVARSAIGWEIVSAPLYNMALCNVPAAGSSPTQQFAYNVNTGAWSLFTGLPALCWVEFGGKLYFGGSTKVFQAENGVNDNGAPIVLKMLPAFSHLKAPGRLKDVKDLRYYIVSDIQNPSYDVAVAINYQEPQLTSGASSSPGSNFFQWDVTPWDGPAVWYSEQVYQDWNGAANVGTVVSDYFKMNLDAGAAGVNFIFRIIATDYLYEQGAVL